MGKRYEYQAPGLMKRLFLAIVDRVRGERTPLQWILDKQTGKRIALDDAESDLFTTLADQLRYFDALPKKDLQPFIDRTFDACAAACFARRSGKAEAFDEFVSWSADDWHRWCSDELASTLGVDGD